MCGRYTILVDDEKLIEAFQIQNKINDFEPSYNVAPGRKILVVIHDGKERRAGYLRWGLVPSWAKDEKMAYKMINARSETAHEKPSFQNLMARKRCLIIADSFYEWHKTEETNQPYRIQVEDRELFAFAGLWDRWQQGDKVIFTCTVLTRESNAFMQNIHHRMPIILPKDKEEEWIRPEMNRAMDAYHFLQRIEMEPLTAYPVSDYINKAKNNDPTCIEVFKQ